jgi:hypothetical protein
LELSFAPLALVNSTISPFENTVALFQVVLKLATVAPPVVPRQDSDTFHLVVEPGPIVLPLISPDVLSFSLEVIIDKVTLVWVLITPRDFAKTVFGPVFILAYVIGPVRPNFLAVFVPLVVLPLTRIVVARLTCVLSVPVGHVILPVAFIDVPFGMNKSSIPISFIIFPLPLVPRSIFPDLYSSSFFSIFLSIPLSKVFVTVSIQDYSVSHFNFGVEVFPVVNTLLLIKEVLMR